MPAPKEIVIRPPSGLSRVDLLEFWRYRYMLVRLVWRNIRLQFHEMYLGFLWACIRPLLYVGVFVLFRRLSNAETFVATAYPLYVYSGLIVWYYFVESTIETAGAVKSDAHLLTKVYYPRLITPLVPSIANLFGLALSTIPMLVMMAWYGVAPSWRLILLPLVIIQLMVFINGIGMAFASITLANRDWERVLTSILYLGLFVSPVIYAPEMIPDPVRHVYFLANPMAGVLLAFRACLFAHETLPLLAWAYSLVAAAAVLGIGLVMYRAAEAEFADRL